MTRYASDTNVSVDRSQREIENALRRFGANMFSSGWNLEPPAAYVQFRVGGRMVRILLALPRPEDSGFNRTPTGRHRTRDAAREAYEQEVRRRWRALSLTIKAKLVAVSEGISTLEREFMADIVLATQETLGEYITRHLGQGPLALPSEIVGDQ